MQVNYTAQYGKVAAWSTWAIGSLRCTYMDLCLLTALFVSCTFVLKKDNILWCVHFSKAKDNFQTVCQEIAAW